jgi:hypothetical protein
MKRRLLKETDGGWELVPSSRFDKKEKGLQTLMENNLEALLDTEFVGSEKRMGKLGRVDSVGIRDSQLVLVEYKEEDAKKDEFAKHIVNQGMHYIVCARNNFEEFQEYVRYELGEELNPGKVPRIILIARDFHTFDRSMLEAFNHQQVVKLKEYDLFGEDKERYFYLADTAVPRDFQENRIPSVNIDLDEIIDPDSNFNKYLLKHPEETQAFLEQVFSHLYSHVCEPPKRKFVKIVDGEVILLEGEEFNGWGDICKIVDSKTTELFNAKYMGSNMRIPVGNIQDIDTVCLNPDGRLILVDYGFGNDRCVSDALLKASWAAGNHSAVQDFVSRSSERSVNWGYDIDLIMVNSEFTERQKHLSDIKCSNIRSRLVRAEAFNSGDERLVLMSREVTKRSLETYVGSMPTYNIEDYISRLTTESAQNALRYVIGEVRDLSDELTLVGNKYGYGIKAEHVFCQIRVNGGDSFNMKIKVGDKFKDTRGICSGKSGDGYARVPIKGSDLDTVKHALGYVRHAFNLDTGRELNGGNKKNGK